MSGLYAYFTVNGVGNVVRRILLCQLVLEVQAQFDVLVYCDSSIGAEL